MSADELRVMHPMHYWPSSASGLPPIACGAAGGFRSSSASSVTCPDCRPLAQAAEALADRRQRAIEAAQDLVEPHEQYPAEHVLLAGIETATRVRIDDEIMAAAAGAGVVPAGMPREQQRRALSVVFRAAGFEVEQ